MFELFKSVVDLTVNVAEVVAAPVQIVVDVTNAAVKPVVEVAKNLIDDVKHL